MTISKNKIGLSVLEVGWLLQKTELQVRGMLRRGELLYAIEGRKIDAKSVDAFLKGEFAKMLLRGLLAGLLKAPKPHKRYAPPAPLLDGLRLPLLMLARPAIVRDSRTKRARVVGRLAEC
jgi:hypothetical protein